NGTIRRSGKALAATRQKSIAGRCCEYFPPYVTQTYSMTINTLSFSLRKECALLREALLHMPMFYIPVGFHSKFDHRR
ncbi:hypothetical protein, partial [Acinetobacter baumannii]|uniref:hypothetical protein n=1 Tax=Acinetobacter baumannii TaxID=470 RepID=UPI0030EB58EA